VFYFIFFSFKFSTSLLHAVRFFHRKEDSEAQKVISVAQSDLMQNVHGKANLVIANIVADIIIRLFDQLDEHLEEDGTLLTSGIIEDRIDDVINAATAHGYSVVKRMENKGWACITFKKQA
jgi:ribosomal protein L11 methyltransferase